MRPRKVTHMSCIYIHIYVSNRGHPDSRQMLFKLDKMVRKMAGAFQLVKLEIDRYPSAAAHFPVRN